MRSLFPAVFSLLALLLAVLTAAHALGNEESVVELTQLTFDSYLKSASHEPVLLQFHAPYCIHCRNFATTYEDIGETLKGKVHVVRVDGNEHSVLRMRFRVQGFPSFYLIHKGKVFSFKGTRSFEDIVNFANSHGERNGKRLDMFGGPLSPYWSVVTTLLIFVERLKVFAISYQDRPITLVAIVFSVILSSLFMLAVALHIATKPRIVRSQQAHPHQQ